MLSKDMLDEERSQFRRGDLIRSRDENRLLGQAGDHYENGSEGSRERELFNEVHRDRFPRTRWNRELLERTVGFVTSGFRATAASTGTNKFDYI